MSKLKAIHDKAKGQPERVEEIGQHVMVCTPAYDGKVDVDYAGALADTAFSCPLFGVKVKHMVMGNGAFIEMARNIFVKKFLELEEFAECTHLFFIDSDLKWEARAFVGLVRSGLPICAGVYRHRQEPETYPAKWTPNPDNGGLWVQQDFVMHDRVPTGFLCISRKVLEEMAAEAPLVITRDEGVVPWLFGTRFDLTAETAPPEVPDIYNGEMVGRFMGEDFAFCDDYRAKYGEPIPVWADFDFRHGGYEGNYHRYLAEQIEAHANLQAVENA